MEKKSKNERFTEIVDKLKKIRGVTYTAIEDKIGIDKNMRLNIRYNRTTVDDDLINKVFEEFPEAYEIEGQEIKKPKSQKLQIEELKERILELERSSKDQGAKLIQLEYILNNLIKDLRLMGQINQIMEEAKKDPAIADAFENWPSLFAKIQSGLGSDESE